MLATCKQNRTAETEGEAEGEAEIRHPTFIQNLSAVQSLPDSPQNGSPATQEPQDGSNNGIQDEPEGPKTRRKVPEVELFPAPLDVHNFDYRARIPKVVRRIRLSNQFPRPFQCHNAPFHAFTKSLCTRASRSGSSIAPLIRCIEAACVPVSAMMARVVRGGSGGAK